MNEFLDYAYGWLDKVLSVTENGQQIASFNYHNDGQIAQAIHNGKSEDFLWDGLALIHRGETSFINEPYVTGGNPILSSKDGVMFNDMLGSTLNIGGKAVNMTAFGESPDTNAMYTGKPYIGELGYAFLFRNYRSDYGKWQTTDPLGYPDGWNNLAYVNNGVTVAIDWSGGISVKAINGDTVYESFIYNVINAVQASSTTAGQLILHSNNKVIFNQTNQRWAMTKKPLLGLGNIEIYNDIYNYKEKENLIGDPVKALIHELIHASGISDENITQSYTEELLTDKQIKNRLDYIRNKFPARGEIQGTMSASGYRYTSTLIYE